jgi:hypothetical protein
VTASSGDGNTGQSSDLFDQGTSGFSPGSHGRVGGIRALKGWGTIRVLKMVGMLVKLTQKPPLCIATYGLYEEPITFISYFLYGKIAP